MAKPAKLTRALAEDMAVAALTFIAQDGERLGRFLTLSGLEPGNLREAAADPSFLAGVLDYLSGDESLLLAFAANFQIDPSSIATAQRLLADDAVSGEYS
ncbi:MAG: DUF3572 domain-containing protein [Xanthobacteraceae bacterium]|nr:DUF3572 domain-containing protein [Xanthobacteraceae bacterium]MBV9628774.1 DUF3572 domain-containing protein [Xanthobacteraceae bacterium]